MAVSISSQLCRSVCMCVCKLFVLCSIPAGCWPCPGDILMAALLREQCSLCPLLHSELIRLSLSLSLVLVWMLDNMISRLFELFRACVCVCLFICPSGKIHEWQRSERRPCVFKSVAGILCVVCIVNMRRLTCSVLSRVSWCPYGAHGDPWLARWPGCHSTHWGNCRRQFFLSSSFFTHFHIYFPFPSSPLFSLVFHKHIYFLTSYSGIFQHGFYSHIVSIVTIMVWQVEKILKNQ